MKKTENYAMPYPEQDDYFNVEDFQNMMVSVDNLMKKLSDSGAQISSDAEHLYNQTKAQMDNIQKRMNAFTALRDGSTTGDAELKDIRVAYDGKEYGNAGEAVREQAYLQRDHQHSGEYQRYGSNNPGIPDSTCNTCKISGGR